jgi:hypothetical protein
MAPSDLTLRSNNTFTARVRDSVRLAILLSTSTRTLRQFVSHGPPLPQRPAGLVPQMETHPRSARPVFNTRRAQAGEDSSLTEGGDMLRKLFVAFIPALALLLAVPSTSQAQFKQTDWDLTLSGSATNDNDFDTFNASAQFGVGYFLSDQFEVGLRPTITLADGGSENSYNVSVFGDFHFDLGNGWVPFIGANIGYGWGDNVNDSFTGGPEGGIKYFLNSTTYVFGNVAYLFDLEESFGDGNFFYGLGLGVRL